jgi:ribosome-associated protein
LQRTYALKSAKKPAKKATKQAAAKKPAAKKTAAKPAKKAVKKAPAKKSVAKPAPKPAPRPAPKPVKKPAKKPVKVAAKKAAAPKAAPPKAAAQSDLLNRILVSLDDNKAENIVTIDLEGRSSLCDAAVIASGRSSRHVAAMADHLARKLKEGGYGTRPISGQGQGDWVLVDAGDVIVHLFRPEVRDYYDLEGMWSVGSRK